MSSWIWTQLALVLASQTAALPAAEDPALELQEVRFLGFSSNEQAYAWQLDLRRAQGEAVDHFRLIQLHRVQDGAVVAQFRGGPIERRSASGARLTVDRARLLAANPDYAGAASLQLWRSTQDRGRFRSTQHPFKDNLVRLLPDNEVHLRIANEKNRLQVRGEPGQALGYTPMARLFDGTQLPLGHFRQEPVLGKVVVGDLEVHHSDTGLLIAVVNRFAGEDGQILRILTAVVHSGHEPIASVKMHPEQIMQWQGRDNRETYRRMHPKTMQQYDKYIGDGM